MDFILFNLRYYKKKIEQYENSSLSLENLYEVKQLLKILDDLLDEGYTYLNQRIEEEFKGISRLKKILDLHNEKPFPIVKGLTFRHDYNTSEFELSDYLTKIKSVVHAKPDTNDAIMVDMMHFCQWIGYDESTAYIFLLRDALLPYLYFKNQERKDLYPWIIGRAFLNSISSVNGLDDIVRATLFCALEKGYKNFADFKRFCCPIITSDLEKDLSVKSLLKTMLSSINKEKILIIESGCHGTFPMMLSALDERVDFRMFTTVPYMKDVYKDKIYTDAYEKNRMIETLTCHDLLLQYSNFHNNMFYVRESAIEDVRKKAEDEIQYFFSLVDK